MSEVDGSGVEDAESKNGGASWLQTFSRWLLGAALLLAGIGHLTWLRAEFQAQVPQWVPLDADLVVVFSGIVEIALGTGLIALPKRRVRFSMASSSTRSDSASSRSPGSRLPGG